MPRDLRCFMPWNPHSCLDIQFSCANIAKQPSFTRAATTAEQSSTVKTALPRIVVAHGIGTDRPQ